MALNHPHVARTRPGHLHARTEDGSTRGTQKLTAGSQLKTAHHTHADVTLQPVEQRPRGVTRGFKSDGYRARACVTVLGVLCWQTPSFPFATVAVIPGGAAVGACRREDPEIVRSEPSASTFVHVLPRARIATDGPIAPDRLRSSWQIVDALAQGTESEHDCPAVRSRRRGPVWPRRSGLPGDPGRPRATGPRSGQLT